MHRLVSLCLAGLLAVALSGCGGSPSSKSTGSTSPEINSNQQLKERLDYIAKSGVTGSALAGMQETVKKTGKADLEKDYGELEKAKSPEEIKTIAKRMADKL
jgi:hypothetical protein